MHDEDGSGDGGFAMDDQAEALLLRTVTVERFVGTFDQPKEPSADSVLGAPRKYSESREISIRYEPVDRYRGVSRVLLRTSVRQWLDRMLALPSQVSSSFRFRFIVIERDVERVVSVSAAHTFWASCQHAFCTCKPAVHSFLLGSRVQNRAARAGSFLVFT